MSLDQAVPLQKLKEQAEKAKQASMLVPSGFKIANQAQQMLQ